MSVDLSALSIDKALSIAMKAEMDAEKLYEKLSNCVQNFVLREKLEFLVKEERKHQQIIKELFYKLFSGKDIMIPDKSLVPGFAVMIEEDSSVVDLLEMAVKAEQVTEEFYDTLSEEVEERGVKDILLYLSNMEHGHYALLKGELELCQKDETYYGKEGFHYDMVHVGP